MRNSGRGGLVGRLTKLEEKVNQPIGDEYEVSGDLDIARECWRHLVAWASAVHAAGGWERAIELVIEDHARAKEAGLTDWLPSWDMSALLYQTVGGLQEYRDRLLAPFALYIQELQELGIDTREILKTSVMLDFVQAVQEMHAASDVTHEK